MRASYACHSPEHLVSRRQFLGGLAAGATGLAGFGGLIHPLVAGELKKAHKQVVVIWLSGGVGQGASDEAGQGNVQD